LRPDLQDFSGGRFRLQATGFRYEVCCVAAVCRRIGRANATILYALWQPSEKNGGHREKLKLDA
jgi:hypothetical protein